MLHLFGKGSTQSQQRNKQQGTRTTLRVCFAVYLFFFIYKVQSPALALAQHQLSRGLTVYEPFIGAIVITALLMGVHILVERCTNFRASLYVLTFLPPALLDLCLTACLPVCHKALLTALALLLLAWFVFAYYETTSSSGKAGESIAPTWMTHLLLLFFITLGMGLTSENNDVQTFEVNTAQRLKANDYEKALTVGERSLATSHHLTALRAYALAHIGKGLGAKLFMFPLTQDGSEALLLRPADSLTCLLRPDSLYALLQTPPSAATCSAATFFKQAAKRHPHSPAADYWLCSLLLDKQLDTFIAELPHYYTVADSVVLPRFYAEAIVLHQRLSSPAKLHYADPNIVANYIDFKEKGHAIANPRERRNRLWREYGETYWWYYFYQPLAKAVNADTAAHDGQ